MRQHDIANGLRSPGGTKRKMKIVELKDDGSTRKWPKILIKETCPACMLEKRSKQKSRKPQGCKLKHECHPAKYHNWFTPVSWAIIEQATKAAGWHMSATESVSIAKAQNLEIFQDLTRETVKGWIDRTSKKP
jgi:hypothetical protein